jgi:hypothetical protein
VERTIRLFIFDFKMNPPRHINRLSDLVLVGVFALALWLPTLCSLCGFQKTGAIDEYRPLAAFPGLSVNAVNLEAFARRFEAYYNDHFGGRKLLIAAHLKIKHALFPLDLGHNVLAGRDGWLYFSGEDMIDNHRGTAKFTLPQLRAWRVLLEKRRDWLAARGIKYLFVIAPNKESVYPEYLPGWLKPFSATKLDQFMDYMRVHSTVEILDLRPALWEARQHGPAYYKTDSHWNLLGAFAACESIITKVSSQIPGLKPVALDNFEIQRECRPGGDLARLAGETALLDDNIYVFTPKNQSPKLEFHTVGTKEIYYRQFGIIPIFETPVAIINSQYTDHAIVFGDSFAAGLEPFLGHHFGQVLFLQKDFNPETIGQDKPVLVISEMLERNLNDKDPGQLLRNEDLDAH